uniref:Aminopeptidase n=1 Tax=Scophthalmus maximus TaxID=52904 RepID=A0A8D3CPP6_SCOMX
MGKVYYVSKNVGLALLVLAAIALATIVALSIAYHKERAKNRSRPGDGGPDSTSMPTPSTTPLTSKDPWDHYRLPQSLVPVSYNVTLWPRLEPNADDLYIFTGHSAVVFRCVKETDLIIIHSRRLNLTGNHAKLRCLGAVTAPAILKSWFVVKTEFLVLQLRSRLAVGTTCALHTEFQGELADDLEGFYRSEYVEDGVKKVVATSQMQATYARKTFPCFDEPAMKAVFNVTIIHSRGTVALSNGREIDAADSVIDGVPVKITTFEPTERMSSYLLAFIVSDFVSIQSNQNNKLLIRIWARMKAIGERQGDYALNVTGPILQFYERYYNATYPLSKSDQIALPDFNAGAMENWGLVTYRETALLYDPVMSSTGNKERVTTVIAHELAHMWFGNLVTLRWWNDLWLNEGFASYVEYLGADHAEPTWNMKDQIILNEVHNVFAVDALASSHPLTRREEEVNDPAQISEMFNTISYSKGAAVVRMLSEFLTEPVNVVLNFTWQCLVSIGVSVSSEFLLSSVYSQAVENTPGIHIPHTVHDIMNRWTLQMGFPVVTIDTRTGSVTQRHFLLDSDSVVERPSQFNYTWFVPIKWMKTGVEQQQYWLLQKTDTNSLMRVSGHDWVLANTNVSGYFRVNYDLDNWGRLVSLLNSNHQALSIINRAQIIDDAFNLARAKIISLWRFTGLYRFTMNNDSNIKRAYLRKQIQPLFEHFKSITADWTKVPTGHTDQYNQINAIGIACSMGVGSCRELIKSWYRQWMANPSHNPIHPNLKSTVYCSAIAFGGAEEWDFAWTMFKNATLASEASRLRSAMACTKKPWLLNRYLEYTLDPTKIRKQDATSTIQTISGNVVGMPLAWNFIRAKWSYIFHQYGRGSFSFSNLVGGITRRFSTEFELQELKKFKEDNLRVGFGSATLVLEQAIEKTTANIKWVTENKAHVLQWLTDEST